MLWVAIDFLLRFTKKKKKKKERKKKIEMQVTYLLVFT